MTMTFALSSSIPFMRRIRLTMKKSDRIAILGMKDILEGTEILEELIEKNEINFIPYGVRIDEHLNGNFMITYQDLEFKNVTVGQAIPLLIALTSLLDAKPIVTLYQIEEELNHFLEQFRHYSDDS